MNLKGNLTSKGLQGSIGKSRMQGILGTNPAAIPITVDNALSFSSTNPVQNKVITQAITNRLWSDEVKAALLQIVEKVAFIDDQGQTYYDALYDALYPPVGLDSIGAVFDSSATIYNTDTLDDLKQYLVVTAYYTSGDSEEVDSYTLSGSMDAGTQTITVAWGGKTTTFTVAVVEWVTSISAVFTQGSAVIYDTDSLDTLEQYLVVTATYADTTTAAVSDYTLSGTLETGTSTITASYVGKSDTFSVTVTHSEVPAGYTMANYIENPNQTTSAPLVNTGVTPSTSGNLDVDIDFMMTSEDYWSSSDKYKYVLAINSGTGYSTVGCCIGVAPDNYTVLAFNGASSSITPNGTSSVMNMRMNISATFTSSGSSITDGTNTNSKSGTGRNHGKPIYLYGLKTLPGGSVPLSYFMKARIYSCTVKDNNTVILNLIPCTRKSDNAAGFWDKIHENFITATGLVAG